MEWRELGGATTTGIAVVGAGVGGCYTAYRLKFGRAGPPHTPVTLYERSHRTGGRIRSVALRGVRGGWADLGAMRLNREATLVMSLLDHLGLGSRLVPFEFGRGENLTYVRGTLLRQHQLGDPGSHLPYRLRRRERGYGPDELTLLAVESAIGGFQWLRARYHRAVAHGRRRDAHTHAGVYRSLRDTATVLGRPLNRLAWSSVLEAALSAEAVRYVDDTGGYDRHGGNAADWIDVLFHTPPHARYVTLSGGMQSLPTTLHESFEAAGGRTCFGHRLCRIDRATPDPQSVREAPAYELTFALEDRAGRDTGDRLRVRAHAVVLALPQGALRHVDGTAFAPTERLRRNIEAVQAVPALKLFLAYAEPWWRERGVTTGRSTTDTPLRQLWYGGIRPPTSPDKGPALLLAAYPNGASAGYWDRFDAGPRYRGPDGEVFDQAPRPSAAMVDHAHELLCAMHRVRIRPPLAACWQNWSRPPHEGAWHVWRPNRRSHAIAADMRSPVPGEAVHVVSDCWTSDPGSIPGVLDCAERVLQDHLGLAPPVWRNRPTRDRSPS
ncbi:FAD-dependent oxidoreductase [Embleya sp. NBC_00896]|uniref:flavin monoamine oxidase family protein n=1 Tax=Embleya sp. NBC_00896 TaxID=2975961 RepID=UPI002F91251E|nr:FAD-dependent oxidoreductase [Embleya sp. NBC_00896]